MGDDGGVGKVRVCDWADKPDFRVLPSVGRYGMTFEVGPTHWGCLHGDLYAKSLRMLMAALDYVDMHNSALAASERWIQQTLTVFKPLPGIVHYPCNEKGELSAMVHPKLQDADFHPIHIGDPALLSMDGVTVIPFEIPEGASAPLEGDIYPFFINEAAYYEEKIAFALATKAERTVMVAQDERVNMEAPIQAQEQALHT